MLYIHIVHLTTVIPKLKSISINFNLPNGADSQCAHNRTGVLCGACKENSEPLPS